MNILDALRTRVGGGSRRTEPDFDGGHQSDPAEDPHAQPRDVTRLALVIGLGVLSWVATYVGMLELIEANLGDLPLIHKIIVGFSVAMLMTMIVWLLDRIFAPTSAIIKACYIAGYVFLSVISVGFGFGFYWKVLESRGEASRSAESAITQVQTSLFAAATRLEQLQSTLDQLTTVSSEKSEVERSTGRSCPNSGPGDGPRRKMREEDAQRFKFASDFVKGRIGKVKSDMNGLEGDLQKIVKDDRSVIDAKTGNRNDFLRGVGRKLDLTVTGFNAFRTDPQLKQIRIDLAERAEKTTITGANGITISCPDGQLQMALRGVVRAIDQLPELEKPKIAAVEGSEATIEAFRRLTTTFFGLMTFKLPPSADELRELQKKAVQSVELQGTPGAPQRAAFAEQAAGLAKRDYVPLSVAIFVDICLLLVSIGRPMNRFVGMQAAIREAERGPVYPILSRFHAIHADDEHVKIFDVFQEVIFDLNGQYHVAVPLNVPRHAPDRAQLRREAQNLANICYALEGKGILVRPMGFLPQMLAYRQLKRRGSKFIECFGDRRPAWVRRRFAGVRAVWADTPVPERPAFKVYRFRNGAWQEMILGAVMGAAHWSEQEQRREGRTASRPAQHRYAQPNGDARHDASAARARADDRNPARDARAWHPDAAPSHAEAYGAYARYMPPRSGEGRQHAPGFEPGHAARVEPGFDAPAPARRPAPAAAGTAGSHHGHGHAQEFAGFTAPRSAIVRTPDSAPAAGLDLAEAAEAANNNTEPGARATQRLQDALLAAVAEPAAPAPAAEVATERDLAAADTSQGVSSGQLVPVIELPYHPVEARADVDEVLTNGPAAARDAPRDPIAVDEISDWFSRHRRKA